MKLIKPTKIEEYQETKADKIIESVFIIGLSLICIILVVLILSTTSHAESSYFPMHQNDNGHFNADSMALIDSYFNSADNNIIVKYIDYNYYCVSFPKSSTGGVYGEIYTNGSNFSLYTSGSVSISVKQFQIMYGSIVNVSNWGTNLYYFYNSPSSLANSAVDYISNYRVYTDSNKTTTVLMYGNDPFSSAQGHATQTDYDTNDNINTGGHAQQPSTPSFPSFPTISIDTTNIESLLESIFNLVDAFADFVGECFSVFFSWVVGVIQNGLQSVINTIRDSFEFIYNNIVSLFEPMFENINKITDFFVSILNIGQDEEGNFSFSLFLHNLIVPEPSELVSIIENNDEYNFIGIFEFLNTAVSAFKDTISNNTRKFITVPQCTFMGVTLGPYQIDFSWYDDYKVYGDGVISAILIFGYLFFLYTRISGILNHEGNSANKAEGGHL